MMGRRSRYFVPQNPKIIATCSRCGEGFRWLPDNFDMRHRFNKETHMYCGGPIVEQDPETTKAA
jgi:hypothetical protein